MNKETETITIRYDFTEEETAQKSKQLAIACSEKKQIEDQKKEVNSEFKYKLDSKDAEINLLSTHIQNGYEMRKVKCEVDRDLDAGKKYYVYNGEIVKTEKLSPEDYQLRIQ